MDKNDPNRAENTIPPSLELRMSLIPGAGRGIFVVEPIPNGAMLGPYEGVAHDDTAVAHKGGYSWQVIRYCIAPICPLL